MKFLTKITAAVWLTVNLLSCSGEAPQLIQLQWMLVDRADVEGTFLREELFIYAQGADEEGVQDLAQISLFYPENDLQWRLGEGQFQLLKIQNENWWGYPNLVMPLGKDFTTGTYRMEIEDRSGQKSSMEFLLERPGGEPSSFRSPGVSLTEETIGITDPDFRDWMLLFYQDNRLIRSDYVSSRQAWDIPEELKEVEWDLYLLYVDDRYLTGWKQGPYER